MNFDTTEATTGKYNKKKEKRSSRKMHKTDTRKKEKYPIPPYIQKKTQTNKNIKKKNQEI